MKKNHLFKAEIGQMLDLVVNSLYSKKEIFLRELVSNASDAIDRAKYLGLVDKELLADAPTFRIDLVADKDARTLSVSDNGYGMDADDLEKNLGTIASSGTKAFTEAVKAKGDGSIPELIGKFGVGFYAAFMVADKVTVVSKKRGEEKAFSWTSDGLGSYEVDDAERDGFGTTITLHLRDDQQEYLDEWRIRDLVKNYSDFIAYPIFFKGLPVEKKDDKKDEKPEEPKPLNTMTALWKRAKKDVKPEEYAEFYRHLAHDFEDPLETIHFSGEGQVEFKSLLFIPKHAGMDIYMPNAKKGLSLYVRNVFIGNDFDLLLPDYLRFVKGVVDSADLPLNVSREMLQDDAVIKKIKSAVTAKILSALEDLKKKGGDKPDEGYLAFWNVFGRVLKEGVHTDWSNSDRIKKLLLYPTAKTPEGKLISLDDYVKAMAKDQKDVYYICADKLEDARHSPQIEQALKHGCDVVFFADPVDEWLVDDFREYDGKKLVDLAKGDVVFGSEEEQKAEKETVEKAAGELKDFLAAVKEQLKDHVADVRVSSRLAESPCCLVAGANAMSASMERMLRAMNQEVPHEKRTLEVNAQHPLIAKMKGLQGDELKDAVELLYDQALISEGSTIPDPGRFAKLLTALMMK
ncbi:MAG: molecular chaperone HtpG [Kiritimatiellae bacterium]|nr:molecular chaperone HtpG [Kiritimatiellia bacterium]